MGVDKQTEAEEHDDLEKPGQSVHKSINLFPVHDFVIAYHHSGDIHGQVTVAFQQVGDGEGEEYKRQQQDRIECLVVYIQPVQHKDSQLSEEITGCGTDNELYGKRAQYLGNSHSGGLDELNQHDCQHICHRVVTTAFQFQHGAQIMLQVHFL